MLLKNPFCRTSRDLSDTLTELYFYEDVDGKYKHIHEPGDDPEKMEIRNVWSLKETFDHEKHGFSLHEFQSRYGGSWEDDTRVKRVFYPEIVDFLKKTTGARNVLIFYHTIRTKANAAKKLTQRRIRRSARRLDWCIVITLPNLDLSASNNYSKMKLILYCLGEWLFSTFGNHWQK